MDKGRERRFRANGARFSTLGRDNDEYPDNCASLYDGSGWWYVGCSISNLNGYFTEYKHDSLLQWWRMNGLEDAGIRLSEMMITKY